MLDLIGERGFLPLACGLIRRSAVQSIGGFEEGLIEDVRLQLKLVDAGFHFEHMPLDQPGFFYRKVNTSLSNSNHTNFWTGVVSNALFVYDRLVAQTWKFEERSPIQCALASAALALSTKSMPSAQWALDIAKSRGINLVAGFPNKYAQVARLVGIKRMLQLAYTYRWLRRMVGL